MIKKNNIRIGFVGAGWMGNVQLHRLCERDDVQVVALCEKNQERGRKVLKDLGLSETRLVDDYQAIIDNPDIDAVWLVGPNSLHGPQAIAAMNAGKHVFCEKPAATTFADFRTQIEIEKANPGLITFVDYILYFDTMAERLRNMVAADEFGKITQIQVNYRHPVNIQGDKAWKLKKEMMGDAIGMGINHALSIIVHTMAAQARPVGVYATSMPAQVRGFEADPIWNIHIRFDNGATGFCFGNIDNGNGYDAYHNLFGTRGGFVFDSQLDREQKIRYWSQETTDGQWMYPLDSERCHKDGLGSLCWPTNTATPDTGDVVEHHTGACVGHFLKCVKTGRQSPLSFVNSAVIAEIGWAAQISAAAGREIPLPLDRDETTRFFFK